jgi:hypothetical protein
MPSYRKTHKKSLKSKSQSRKRVTGGKNGSLKRISGFMIGGGPGSESAIRHITGDYINVDMNKMYGGAKGNDRQKQNTEVFKQFAVKTFNAIDIASTSIKDTQSPVSIKDPDVKDFFSKVTDLVRYKIHPSKALIEKVIIQDMTTMARRIYTEFMGTFLLFDADPEQMVKTTKGLIYGNKNLDPDKVQKIKNRLRPAVEENIKAFMKDFVKTVIKKAKNMRKEMKDGKDIVAAQRIAASAITEYTQLYKQNPDAMIKRFITNLKLSIMLYPSVSLDFHVHENPGIIKKNIKNFARKYFPNMLGDFNKLTQNLAPPSSDDKVIDDEPEDENDLLRENNRLYAQFLRVMNDIKPFLKKKKSNNINEEDGFGQKIGPDGLIEPESFRNSVMKGMRRVTTSVIIRSIKEMMKMVGDGEKPFTATNISQSMNTMQQKLIALRESINEPETQEYLTNIIDACRGITEAITNDLREPIIEGADKMMEIGMEAASKIMKHVAKFTKNMIRVIPVVGDLFVIAENGMTVLSAGMASAAGLAGVAKQGIDSTNKIKAIITDTASNSVSSQFNSFKEYYNKFMDSLYIEPKDLGMATAIQNTGNYIEGPDPNIDKKKEMQTEIENTNIDDISTVPPPDDPEVKDENKKEIQTDNQVNNKPIANIVGNVIGNLQNKLNELTKQPNEQNLQKSTDNEPSSTDTNTDNNTEKPKFDFSSNQEKNE